MYQPTKEERLAKVHDRALQRFDTIQAALRDERLQCLKDRRFYSIAGAQWEGPLGEQFENVPRFELNKIHLAVIRIINEYRNNRISVEFQPKDGTNDDQLSDACAGVFRADEQDSVAQEAYDNCFEEGVGGGFGAWRLRADYEDDEDEDADEQRVLIEPIFDADSSVFFDLDAKRYDKADAKFCYVLTSMSPGSYTDQYGDDPADWPKIVHQRQFDWATPDVVYVAEYYEIEEKSEIVHVFQGIDLGNGVEPDEIRVTDSELKDNPERLEEMAAKGYREVRQKKVKRKRVHKYTLSGAKVLEDQGYIAGTCIPIVPFYGKRWFVDNVERCMGHVRLARDAQMLKNMLISKLGEISTQSPIEKPILFPEQIAGHQVMWSEDNIKKYPYLLINQITSPDGQPIVSGPVAYTKAPGIPPALAALLQITEQDLQDLLGNQQAGEEVHPNISGRVVELIQTRLDMQVFIYMSNFAKSMKRSGEIWLSMMKDIAVEQGRKMKTVSPDNKASSIELMKPAYDEESGEEYMENDFSRAKMDVVADVGPSSSSRRNATVRALTGMLQLTQDPQDQQVLTAMAMMNMEGEGIEEVRDYYRQKLLRMGAIKPTPEEAKQLQAEAQAKSQQVDPQSQYLQAAAEEAVSRGANARADTVLKIAKAEQARADAAKTLSEVGVEHRAQMVDAATALVHAAGNSQADA